ncbi:MAG: queuosine salvage family protein [Desulfobacterales bacterium]
MSGKIQPDSNQIFDRIRTSCRKVAKRASRVKINYSRIPAYAASLPVEIVARPQLDPDCHYLGKKADTVNFLLTLNTINFGSGYFPHLRKRTGMSGYFTMASSLNDAYKIKGPLSAGKLAEITAEECTVIFDQDPGNKIAMELMQHFSTALNDLGRFVRDRFNGSFTDLVESTESSAWRLVQLLKMMPCFNDVASYDELEVLFYKRAQIIAADLSLAFQGRGWGHFEDLDQMTIFADNLVPHVLRIDGILIYEASLLDRINSGDLIPAGSPEEVEIRACAVHAVELIKNEIAQEGEVITSPAIDNYLWNRGQQPEYKAEPRHRTRCLFY